MKYLLLALVIAQAVSFPLQGEEISLLQEVPAGLMPDSADETTVEAEVNAAISHDVNLDSMGQDVGESMDEHASSWEKKAAADINAMSRDALKRVHVPENDAVVDKFQQDVQAAKMAIATPKQREVSTETDLEREADEELKDPKKAKELLEESAQAEMDLAGPMSFLQEDEDDDADFTDDEDDVDGLALMGGSDADVEKAIMGQITNKVNTQLGGMPVNSGTTEDLEKFAKDKAEAAQFVSTNDPAKQAKIKTQMKIKEELKQAQAALTTSQAEEGDEEQARK